HSARNAQTNTTNQVTSINTDQGLLRPAERTRGANHSGTVNPSPRVNPAGARLILQDYVTPQCLNADSSLLPSPCETPLRSLRALALPRRTVAGRNSTVIPNNYLQLGQEAQADSCIREYARTSSRLPAPAEASKLREEACVNDFGRFVHTGNVHCKGPVHKGALNPPATR
ncbi:hypothetical protein X777_11671, partial [Ooceraea biroi]